MDSENSFKIKAIGFLAGVAGLSIISGFGMTLAAAKKKDPHMFSKGMIGERGLHEAGSTLALRALGWGSLYAVSGVSLFCFVFWKLMNVNNFQEFRDKVGAVLPRIPKNDSPVGQKEFTEIRDLLQ